MEARRRREIAQVAKRQMQRSSIAGDLSLAQAKDGEPVERGRYIGS